MTTNLERYRREYLGPGSNTAFLKDPTASEQVALDELFLQGPSSAAVALSSLLYFFKQRKASAFPGQIALAHPALALTTLSALRIFFLYNPLNYMIKSWYNIF